LVLVYVLVTIIPLYPKLELIEFMLLLAFLLYLIHEIEEYVLPGGHAAWLPYFFSFQALPHLCMGIVGKMYINPGIRSSFVLHTPYAIFMIYLLSKNGVISNPYINMYMVIGFLFNGLLPLMAKYIAIPRCKKCLREAKEQL